jgi:hypothetical protein
MIITDFIENAPYTGNITIMLKGVQNPDSSFRTRKEAEGMLQWSPELSDWVDA